VIPLRDRERPGRTAWVTWLIAIACAATWIWQLSLGDDAAATLALLAPSAAGIVGFEEPLRLPARLVASMFLHGGLLHLIGNLAFLLVFCDDVEAKIRPRRFLILYFGSGVVATLAQALGVSDQELNEILAQADRSDLNSAGPWDGITVVNGYAKVTGGSGSGLLYVRGNLDLSGGFEWTGLVYVEGQLKNTGNVWILGGVMVRGGGFVTAVDFGAGTPTILYSRAALVQTLMRAMDYIVLSWKEI